MKKILITIGAFFATIIAITVFTWLNPEVFIKPKVIRWSLNKFLPKQQIHFDEFKFVNKNHSFFKKTIRVEFSGFCFNLSSATLEAKGCLDELILDSTFLVGFSGIKSFSLNELAANAEDLLSIAQKASDTEEAQKSSLRPIVQVYRESYASFQKFIYQPKPDISISFKKVEYEYPSKDQPIDSFIKINANIDINKTDSGLLTIETKAKSNSPGKPHVSLQGAWGPNEKLELSIEAKNLAINSLNLKASNHKSEPGSIDIDIKAQDKSLKMFKANLVELSLTLREKALSISTPSSLRFVPGSTMIHVFNRGCGLEAKVDDNETFDLDVNCLLVLRYPFTYGKVDFDLANKLHIKSKASDLSSGRLTYSTVHQDKYTKLNISTDSDYDLSDSGEDKLAYIFHQILPELSVELKLNKIRDWLSSIPEKYTAMPAPLNSMNGSLDLIIMKSEGAEKKATLSLDIRDKTQRIDFDLSTKAKFKDREFEPSLELDFKLNHLALQLPKWNFRDPKPSLFNDSRYKTGVKNKMSSKQASTKKPTIQLNTEASNPIQIFSNLIEDPIRFLFSAEWDNSSLAKIDIKVLPLKAEFLRRKFEIESARYQSQGADSPSYVDAQLKFLLPDYTVTANLEGTTDQPVVSLSSKPPLSENDIYSVLVFGKPMSGLETDQQSSLAAARQTFAAGLFSLTSLYFLGSTPIESIYFDPESGEATARVRLDSKSSVSVGGDTSDVNRVEVRRSLGKGWYIQAGVRDLDQGTETYGTSVEKVISY
jgi:hypothetical protein